MIWDFPLQDTLNYKMGAEKTKGLSLSGKKRRKFVAHGIKTSTETSGLSWGGKVGEERFFHRGAKEGGIVCLV